MKVNITHLPPRAVLYARATGPYAKGAETAWRQLMDWLTERDRQHDVVAGYGWFRDDPATINPFLQRYDACIELLAGISSDFRAGIGRQTLPGGYYVIHMPMPDQATDPRQAGRGMSGMLAERKIAVDTERSMLERVTLDAKSGVWTASPHVLVPVTSPEALSVNAGLRVA